MENKVILKDIVYDIIDEAQLYGIIEDGRLVLGFDIEAQTENENIDHELRYIRFYNEYGFDTYVSEYKELKGKKYIWDAADAEDMDDEEMAGTLYVLDHEDVAYACLEVLDVGDDTIKIKFSGCANVYWSDDYWEDVPFETVFIASLPEIICE